MKYRNIKLGVSVFSDIGHSFRYDPLNIDENIVEQVLKRDDFICQYCGFRSVKHQVIHYICQNVKDASEMKKVSNFVTSCHYCQQCFYLDRAAMMQSATIIWLPEIGQAALNHICRAIYIARITQGPIADAARESLDILLSRKKEAENRIGTDDVVQLATILQDFMESREYKNRQEKLQYVRVMPLDRRIVQEGELEFNQFPQILAYWRSKDGPFGKIPPRKWAEIFHDIKKNAV